MHIRDLRNPDGNMTEGDIVSVEKTTDRKDHGAGWEDTTEAHIYIRTGYVVVLDGKEALALANQLTNLGL